MRYLRYLLILALISLAVWRLSPHFSGFSDFFNLLKTVKPFWLVMAILSIAGQYLGDGWLSQILLKVVNVKTSLKDNLKISVTDVFAAHLLPLGEAGVIATSFFLYKKIGVDNQSLISLSVLWALFTNFVLIIMFLASIVFLPKIPNISIHPSQITLLLLIVLIVTIPLIYLNKNLLWRIFQKHFSDKEWFGEILKFFKNIRSHSSLIRKDTKTIIKALAAAFIYYGANVACLAFSFLAFGSLPPLSVLTFVYILSLLASWITLAPAGVGASEATLIIILPAFGINPSLAVAATLTFRIISNWLPVPFGAFSYFSIKNNGKT